MSIGKAVPRKDENELVNALWQELVLEVSYTLRNQIYSTVWDEVENEVEDEIYDKINIG